MPVRDWPRTGGGAIPHHVPPQGLSFRSQKGLATALAGSLGPVAFTRQFTLSWRGAPSSALRRFRASCGPRARTHRRRLRAGRASIGGSSSYAPRTGSPARRRCSGLRRATGATVPPTLAFQSFQRGLRLEFRRVLLAFRQL